MIGLTSFSECSVTLPRKPQWIRRNEEKNCLRDSLPVVCVERISCLNEIHPIQAWLTDRINAQTFLNCDLFFLQMTTRFWRFKKGLRNVWSNKECSETPRLSSNIAEIKLVSPSMYENTERKKGHCLSERIHRKHVFGVDFVLFIFSLSYSQSEMSFWVLN